jgi:DNA-binding CsgD family transcriptional regulator
LKKKLAELFDISNEDISEVLKEALADCYEELKELSKRIAHYDKKIESISNEHEYSRLFRTNRIPVHMIETINKLNRISRQILQ